MSEKRIHVFGEIVIVLASSLVLACTLNIKAVNAQAGQVTLNPSDDTYVDSSNNNSNYGGQDYLAIMNFQSTYSTYLAEMKIAWLKFNLSSVPNGAVIDGATLSLFASYVGETFGVTACYCSNNSWTELGMTWSTMPTPSFTSVDSVLVATANQWYNWSVVYAVRDALNSNAKAVTIVLFDPSPNSSNTTATFQNYYSSGGSDPFLYIHWSSIAVPEFPTFLILPFFMIATLLAVAFYKKKAIPTRILKSN